MIPPYLAPLWQDRIQPRKETPVDHPPEEDYGDVLQWAWAAKRQLDRYLDYYAEDVTVYSPAPPDDAPDGAWYWEEWQAAIMTDLHFLLIACAHLVKVARRVRAEAGLAPVADELEADIRDMRNIWEHWDEHREAFQYGGDFERSGASLAERHPDVHPQQVTIGREISVGPIELERIWREVDRIEQHVRRVRRPRGRPPRSDP